MERLIVFAKLLSLTILAFGIISVAQAQKCEPPSFEVSPLHLEPVIGGLNFPVYVTHAGDGSGRLFVVEKDGLIRIIEGGQILAEPFVDIRDQVATTGEQGLLSIAFHPGYQANGRFFMFYSDRESSSSLVVEYLVAEDDPNQAEPEGRVLLRVPQDEDMPFHRAGQMQFGPDGYLYVAIGDGGGYPAPQAQDLSSLYGSILRLDVDRGDPYAIPADNPFVGVAEVREEIWAYGFRNPWRFSIDPCTGQLFVGDVGEQRYEEVNLVEPGVNYGWPVAEASHCMERADGACGLERFGKPIFEYAHASIDPSGGNAVIGGYIYRGTSFPELVGHYLVADFSSGRIWALSKVEAWDVAGHYSFWKPKEVAHQAENLASFGVDEDGELYALGFVSGTLFRVVPERNPLEPLGADLLAEESNNVLFDGWAPVEGGQDGAERWRWALGPRSALQFVLEEGQMLELDLRITNPIPGQDILIEVNGVTVLALVDLEQGERREQVRFEGTAGVNRIVFTHQDWNMNETIFAEGDSRNMAVRFDKLSIKPVSD
jgi:glucose/arabinose dehydrogenase